MKKLLALTAVLLFTLAIGGLIGALAQRAGYLGQIKTLVTNTAWHLPGLRESSKVEGDNPSSTISTVFFPLTTSEIALPPLLRGRSGGGLTASPDGGVILLRLDGTFWRVIEDTSPERLPLEPPQNNYDAYAAFSETEEGATYSHNLRWFRYNDVEWISHDGQDKLLASFSYYDEQARCHANRVAVLDITDGILSGTAADWRTLYTSEPCLPLKREFRAIEGHAAGGRLVYDGNGSVFIGNGEFHFDAMYGPEDMVIAQDPDGHYGGVVRISLDTEETEVLSRGNRNMQGVAIDGQGRIWVAEHGMRGGDEINIIKPGANYGWPYVSYGTAYSELPLSTVAPKDYGRHDGYEKPLLAFVPSLAVSSLATVNNFDAAWNGDMLVGSLRGRTLIRVRTSEDRVIFAERIPIGERIRDLQETTDGAIALWTDANKVVFLRKSRGGLGGAYVDAQLATLADRPALQSATTAVMAQCRECHSLNRGNHQNAPSLAGIIGREIGSTNYTGYSDTLRQSKDIWTPALLEEFLDIPEASFEGTAMPQIDMSQDVRKEIVRILKNLSKTAE